MVEAGQVAPGLQDGGDADTATSLNNLAIIRQKRGDLEGAEVFYRRALAIRDRALGPNHADTGLSPSKLCGTPDCNESAALHSYGLDAHCRSVLREPTTGRTAPRGCC